jgi:hypothetical protein
MLNVHNVSDALEIDIHIVELLVTGVAFSLQENYNDRATATGRRSSTFAGRGVSCGQCNRSPWQLISFF